MTSIEFATLCDIRQHLCDIEIYLSKMIELFESMDARLQNLESSMK